MVKSAKALVTIITILLMTTEIRASACGDDCDRLFRSIVTSCASDLEACADEAIEKNEDCLKDCQRKTGGRVFDDDD